MSLSSQSSCAENRAVSPKDENGNPKSDLTERAAAMKQDRYADLKRRSAQAFSVFANEEREKLQETHPDLPMGLVTKMMVDKWRNLDGDAKMSYFEAARTTPLKTKKPVAGAIAGSTPSKKPRPFIAYKTAPVPVSGSDQVAEVEGGAVSQPTTGRVVYVQGRQVNQAAETPRVQNPSSISTSIAHALGMPVTSTPRTVSSTSTPNPQPFRTLVPRSKLHSSVVVSSQQITAKPMSVQTSANETQGRHENGSCAFATSQQALDMFYLALCEPAFPHPNEPPLTPYPANYCYEAYMKMTSGQGHS